MRIPSLGSFLAACGLVTGLFSSSVQAASSIVLAGSYADKLVNDPDLGLSVVTTGSASVQVSIPLAGVDISSFDESTGFDLEAGPLSLSFSLGDDPHYTPGRKTATFRDSDSGASLTVTWTAASIVVSGKSPTDAFGAEGTYGNPGTPGVTHFSDTLAVTVSLGDFSSPEYEVDISGKNTDVEKGNDDVGFNSLESGSFTGAADFTAPVVTIASPKSNSKTSADGTITIKGTASDNLALNTVSIQLNGGDPTTIFDSADNDNGPVKSTSWSVTIDPGDYPDEIEGLNVLYVTAQDSSGNSKVALFYFIYSKPEPLSLTVNPGGSVSGLVNGNTYLTGTVYPAVATPSNGWIFGGWMDENNNVISALPKLNFNMHAGAGLTANFLTSPYPAKSATYVGLFSADDGLTPTNAGYMAVTLGHNGAWTAKLLIGAGSYPISGQFGDDSMGGISSGVIINPKTKPLLVLLSLDASANPTEMALTISSFASSAGGDPVWTASSQKLFLCGPATPAPTVGRYNIALPGLPASVDGQSGLVVSNGPYGYGYASATLDAKGNVVFVANLPDNTSAFSFSTFLTTDGRFPFYASLYKGKGIVGGWMIFTNDAVNLYQVESTEQGAWIALPGALKAYPNGFSTDETPFDQIAGGELYIPLKKGVPLFGQANAVTFAFDLYGGAQSFAFNPAKDTFALTAPASASFNPATGILTGAMPYLKPKVLNKFSGIYLIGKGVGYGFMDYGIPFTFYPTPVLGIPAQ
ncbi:MAG TPA: Ig-like domain-containing protein [Verrucomicrobiae bacterium]|jgi:hypothetical protein|nr:Ig-like domain-containing protein [Verrucomicrobiae bacterium]